MPKAKTLDRLELTRMKMGMKAKYTKENSPFLQMVKNMRQELDEAHTCPICGGELVHYEGCYRCKKCGWSKC